MVSSADVVLQAQAKRDQDEQKRLEQLAKKAELKRLQEEEEAAMSRPKPSPKANRVSRPKVGLGRYTDASSLWVWLCEQLNQFRRVLVVVA